MRAIQVIGDTQITVDSGAVKRRDAILADAADITEITSDFDMSCATDAMRKLKECSAGVEACRTEVKAPIITAGRKIDTLAKEFVECVIKEEVRIRGLMNGFAARQEEQRRAAEAARQAELQRIDRERRAAELAEQTRAQEAQRAADAARKAQEDAECAFTAGESAAALQREQEAKNAALKAELALIEERKRRAALEQEAKAQLPVPVAPRIQGMTAKTVWLFEVLDIRVLHSARPDLCVLDVSTASVNDAIRAGAREIPGLRIYSEMHTIVRR